MPDDILDAAQKQINDAAQKLASDPSPPSPPQLKEEALLKEPVTPATTAPTTDTDEVNSIMESVLGSDKNVDKKPSQPDLTPTVLPPPGPPKRSKVGVILAVLLFLLLTIPLGVYFISQQQQLADLRGRAIGPYPTTTPGPSGTPTGNCNDCGGFNQGQCGVGGSDTINCNPNNSPCEGGMTVCDGGCYPSNYHSCKAQGRGGCYPPETSCDQSDPCAGVRCPANQYCNGGACVTGQGGNNIVSFICSQCTADRRCDTGGSVGTHGYGNPCGQVDECQKNADGSINYSTCKAIKLCDPSCSGGGTTPTPGGGGSPTPPGGEHTPTPTHPPSGPECRDIKIYKGDEEVSDLTSLKPGDEITVGVKGDNAVKAHIRLNGAAWVETDTKNDKGEFIKSFTIPANATKVTLEAEVTKNGTTWE